MHYIALDCETTGLSPFEDRICEIGAVRFKDDGTVLDRMESLVRPGIPCNPKAFAAHGLSDELLDSSPDPAVVLPEFRKFLGSPRDTILLAHNASFDLAFLRVACSQLNLPAIAHDYRCTLRIARDRWPGMTRYALPHLCEWCGIPTDNGHRAMADAERVRLLWDQLSRGYPRI